MIDPEPDDGTSPDVEITLRVPGPWTSPEAFADALPDGYGLHGDETGVFLLTPPEMPGGDPGRVPLNVRAFDDTFVQIFAGGVDRMPSEADRAGVEAHEALVCAILPGGTPERAADALRHAAALIRAGGHGVFVDNSGIAHGSDDWLRLADEADDGGPFWALVNLYGSPDRLWSIGMHTLGRRDGTLVGRSGDDRQDAFTLRNFLAFAASSGTAISDGDQLADDTGGERLTVSLIPDDITEIPTEHPMHNPFGRYLLERHAGIAADPTIARGPA